MLSPLQRVSSASRLPGRYRVEIFTRWVAPPFFWSRRGTGRGRWPRDPGRACIHGVRVRVVHVHRDQGEVRLLVAREALEPAFERALVASLADPERLAGLEVAHDGHELVVAASEPLLVHADLSQADLRPRRLPALEGLLFGERTLKGCGLDVARSATPTFDEGRVFPPRLDGKIKPIRSPLRPERHFADSFITVRLALTRAIARWLLRCPVCHRERRPNHGHRRDDVTPHHARKPSQYC